MAVTWPPEINWTEAQQSLTNLSASNYTEPINATEYPDIVNFTNVSFTNQTQTANAIFSPFNAVWLPVFGYYIYFIIMIVTTTAVFFKTKDFGSAGSTLLLMCALAAATTQITTSPVFSTFQVFVALGIMGVLMRIFTGKQ